MHPYVTLCSMISLISFISLINHQGVSKPPSLSDVIFQLPSAAASKHAPTSRCSADVSCFGRTKLQTHWQTRKSEGLPISRNRTPPGKHCVAMKTRLQVTSMIQHILYQSANISLSCLSENGHPQFRWIIMSCHCVFKSPQN